MKKEDLILPAAVGAGVLGLGLLVSRIGRGGSKEPSPSTPPSPSPSASPPPMVPPVTTGAGAIVLNGRRVAVPVPVNHSLQFRVGEPGVSARTRRVSLGVIHWSGGEPSDGSGVYRTLRERGLAVHFIIDRQGTLWQCADPGTTVGSDASSVYNRRSWGVEVVGSVRGRGRTTYPMILRGEEVTAFDFFPVQYTALFALADACSGAFDIPRVVAGPPWQRLPLDVRNNFEGVVGHLHISPQKPDPGSRPLERLAARPGWRQR